MHIVVITTCATRQQASELASQLVKQRLAACVQINAIESIYHWQGAVESASEQRLTIKARLQDYAAIEAFIQEHHAYDVPEIIALPVAEGAQAYLDWIDAECARP